MTTVTVFILVVIHSCCFRLLSPFLDVLDALAEDINCDDEESETDNESTANLDDVDEEEIERLKQQVMSAEDLPDAPSSDECDDESVSADSLESV